MESLYVLIPLSLSLVLVLMALFGWALYSGQFDELDHEAERILESDPPALDADQTRAGRATEQFNDAAQTGASRSVD